MMTSSDYKERFRAEYFQLKIRTKKLKKMLEKLENGELDFEPICPKELLYAQLEDMTRYLGSLFIRATFEDISLEENA